MGINLRCAECGGNNLRLEDAPTDETVVTCQDCGTVVGTVASLKDEVVGNLAADRR